jgi:hypothetical protein
MYSYSGKIGKSDLKDKLLQSKSNHLRFAIMKVQAYMRKNGEYAKKLLRDSYLAFRRDSDEKEAYIMADLFRALTDQNEYTVRGISTSAFLHDVDRDFSKDEEAQHRLLVRASYWFCFACEYTDITAAYIFAILGNLMFAEGCYNYSVELRLTLMALVLNVTRN